MLVDPVALLKEGRDLETIGVQDAFSRITIEEGALVITPLHQAINRLKVLSSGKHLSCGMGVSEAVADFKLLKDDTLFVRDMKDTVTTIKKMEFLREVQQDKLKELRGNLPNTSQFQRERNILDDPQIASVSSEVYQYFSTKFRIVDQMFLKYLLKQPGLTVFEGAQGVLLDPDFGFYPYTTSTNTTFKNAQTLLDEGDFSGKQTKIGLLRAFATRHGEGPLVTEDHILTPLLKDQNNPFNIWQGQFRVGYFDLVTAGYGLDVVGSIDSLAITHVDKLREIPEWKVACSYLDKNDHILEKLDVSNPLNIGDRQNLTRLIEVCTPLYDEVENDQGILSYIKYLEERLGMSVSILSFGSSSKEKVWLDQRLKSA